MEYMVQVKGVTKSFKETTVLQDVSVELKKGSIYGLIGRNGAGKTMLIKCICGFVIPDKGEIVVNNQRIGKDREVPDSIGIIIENPGFLPQYSGFHNLKFLATIRNKINNEKIYETLELVGLNPKMKKQVGKYSLGMRQRLGIAQAIMEDPDLLILDEPMNGLDNQGVEDMRKLFLSLKEKGKTIILASHSKEDIEVLCDSVIEMDHGKIV